MNLVQTFSVALPEFILVAVALSLVLVAAFANSSESEASTLKLVRSLSLGGYGLAFLSLLMLPAGQVVLFNGLFATDGFALYMKGLVLLGAFFSSWLVSDGWQGQNRGKTLAQGQETQITEPSLSKLFKWTSSTGILGICRSWLRRWPTKSSGYNSWGESVARGQNAN